MRFTLVILSAVLCLNVHAQSEEKSDEALVAAAEKLIAEEAATGTISLSGAETAAVAAQSPAPEKKELKESEIPVLIADKKSAKAESGVAWRLIASLVLILGVGGAVLFAAKKWAKQKDKGGERARIEILHQYHLGPRKSLILVRVSGEAMLIGATDQNINMLKPITLIDDELEHVMNKDFNNFLEDEFSVEDVRRAIGSQV